MIIFKKFSSKLNISKEDDFDDPKLSQAIIWNSSLTFTIIGALSFAIIYAFLAKIDEVVLARGELQAIGAERPIKSTRNGIIKEINIKEGQKVKKNTLLISIDTKPLELKLNALIKEKSNIEKALKVDKEIFFKQKQLYEMGAISLLNISNTEKDILELDSRLQTNISDIKTTSLAIKNSNIVSPLDGSIFDLIPKNSGYYTSAGETLLKIVPGGELEAKIFINNTDIGFVKEGMRADIRVDAFPFSRFGSISGTVKNIADEVLPIDNLNRQTRYPVYLKLDSQFLKRNKKQYSLQAGQSIGVNLIVKERPIITLFTDIFSNSIDSLKSIKSN